MRADEEELQPEGIRGRGEGEGGRRGEGGGRGSGGVCDLGEEGLKV